MKIFTISNLNIGIVNNVIQDNKWYDIIDMYFDDFLIPEITSKYNNGDFVLFNGNIFSSNITPKSIVFALKLFKKLNFKCVILKGKNEYSTDYNVLDIFNSFQNIKIINDFYNVKNVSFVPYKANINLPLLTHVFSCNTEILTCEYLYNNSIEYKQSGNVTGLGTAFKYTKNNHVHGITIIDTERNTQEFIENKITPIFIDKKVKSIEDFNNLNTKDFYTFLIHKNDINEDIQSFIDNNKQYKYTIDFDIVTEKVDLKKLSTNDVIHKFIRESNCTNNSELLDLYNEIAKTFN